jgi:hypothetical protein
LDKAEVILGPVSDATLIGLQSLKNNAQKHTQKKTKACVFASLVRDLLSAVWLAGPLCI